MAGGRSLAQALQRHPEWPSGLPTGDGQRTVDSSQGEMWFRVRNKPTVRGGGPASLGVFRFRRTSCQPQPIRPSGAADVPRALWEHACRVTGRTKQRDERWTCFRCRERARLASLSYSVVERMGRYSRTYGLGSVGLHRALADKLLSEIPVIDVRTVRRNRRPHRRRRGCSKLLAMCRHRRRA